MHVRVLPRSIKRIKRRCARCTCVGSQARSEFGGGLPHDLRRRGPQPREPRQRLVQLVPFFVFFVFMVKTLQLARPNARTAVLAMRRRPPAGPPPPTPPPAPTQ